MGAQHEIGSVAGLAARLAEELQRAKDNIARSAGSAGEDLAVQLRQLQDDVTAIQNTIGAFGKAAGAETGEATARMGAAGAEAAHEFAAGARERAHSMVRGFEEFARRNPHCVLGCTLGLGLILGLMMRKR